VAHRLTSVPGSSGYFRGSIVAYHNDIKQEELGVKTETLAQYGAVSEATVREMAEGARRRLGVDVAVATSGIAGPGGATETKKVGTVCLAYADAHQTISKEYVLDRGRSLNVDYAAQSLLTMLRQQLAALSSNG
jgi:nicotinamide-nucleotide amidase